MKHLAIVLSLILTFTASAHADYSADYAKEMVYVSGLAYCSADNILARKCNKATELTEGAGMTVLHAKDNGLDKNGITYVILKRESTNELFMAFSGTRDTAQLITEIGEAFPVKYSIHTEVKDALVFDYFLKHYVDGFRDDILSVMPEILSQYPGYDITFTGHSLGAALTIHAASDLILNGWNQNRKVRVYTYGQPRVGNPAFNSGFESQVIDAYRLTHYRDIVAHIPPCIPGVLVSCESSGLLPFYPYHTTQEIFYDEPFASFTSCSTTDGEDKKCSNSHVNDSVNDHLYYFGIDIGGLSSETDSKSTISKLLK